MQRTYVPWDDNQFVTLQITDMQKQEPFFIQEGWKELEHAAVVACKNSIANVENADEWDLRKKIMNPYEAVFSGEDGSFPSLVRVQPLSRSYFKMIEMLEHSDFWKAFKGLKNTSKEPFISAHICEGPGGFVQATIEHLVKHKIPVKGVYAMTLKPTKSNIPGWRRSTHFLKKYPQVRLEYGADDTGDILKPTNQSWFSQRAKGAHLFTADGGFDFSVDYTNQEKMAFPLLLSSFTIGLNTLNKGGTMIIKLFDIYGNATQDLILGSALLFDSFTIYKPATSRPCNSERYFIGKGYHGKDDASAAQMISHLQQAQVKHAQSPLTQLFKNPWPEAVQHLLKEQETLHMKNELPEIYEHILTNICQSKAWCKRFGF